MVNGRRSAGTERDRNVHDSATSEPTRAPSESAEASGIMRAVHMSDGNQEAGANPARSRHCDRGANPMPHGRMAGRRGER
ncbi:hypothetical protein Sdia_37390 [Streptomyces diastaticus subsp. diastaticus]|uniref:Uncharacterized protein n=1 Tax=Streptomyces diastaticus subsp. diastaticus TaxID=68040 RepID=A0ABQ1CS38_STRDI|nr:hypothetical protein Sdia_37390 [Streptomyces diastaticus subsp. diastaticus]GGU48731.1 hypothetical protein GCM10015534_58650 [Streptomyces diastaticus subsp. diastaticus]